MEDFNVSDLQFEDIKLDNLVYDLSHIFRRQNGVFVDLCVTIYKIWEYCKGNYWKAKDNEYYNSYKLLAKFGFDKKAVSRYKSIYEKFIFHIVPTDTYKLLEDLQSFSPSKLFELLSLTKETTLELVSNKLIKPDMTVKQIRDYIMSLKDGTDKAEKVIEDTIEINEEDIPLAYNPSEEYEYSYFESKTKNQLLNIVWELQKAYQKLKGEKKNVKQSNK